jgi:hypothetical protein
VEIPRPFFPFGVISSAARNLLFQREIFYFLTKITSLLCKERKNSIFSKSVGKPDRFWKPVRFFPENLEKIQKTVDEDNYKYLL